VAFRCEFIIGGTAEVPVRCCALVTSLKGLRIHRRLAHGVGDQIELPFSAKEPEAPEQEVPKRPPKKPKARKVKRPESRGSGRRKK
jgi:hypothetical protein